MTSEEITQYNWHSFLQGDKVVMKIRRNSENARVYKQIIGLKTFMFSEYEQFISDNTFEAIGIEPNKTYAGSELDLVWQFYSDLFNGWVDSSDHTSDIQHKFSTRQIIRLKSSIADAEKPKERELPESIQKLSDSIEAKGLKITFGIQPKHIEVIEALLKMYDDIEIKGEKHPGMMLYSEHFWDEVGKKVGWLPFTIALHYFKSRFYKPKVVNHPVEILTFENLLIKHGIYEYDVRMNAVLAEYIEQQPLTLKQIQGVLEHIAINYRVFEDNAVGMKEFNKQGIFNMAEDIYNKQFERCSPKTK